MKARPLKLRNARLVDEDGYTYLGIDIDGYDCRFMRETHEPFMKAKVVVVTSHAEYFDARLPPREIDVEGQPMGFDRLTDDPRLFALFVQYVKWSDMERDAPAWKVGEAIPIPEMEEKA